MVRPPHCNVTVVPLRLDCISFIRRVQHRPKAPHYSNACSVLQIFGVEVDICKKCSLYAAADADKGIISRAGLRSPSNPIILQHVVSKKGMFPTPFIWRLELDPSFDAAVPINITNYAPPHSGFTTDDLKERNATTVICVAAAAAIIFRGGKRTLRTAVTQSFA